MPTFARFLQILALAVWIGGIIFFSFVVAPSLFALLPVTLAGGVVSRALATLHYMGLVCGAIFLAASLLRELPGQKPMRVLVLLMMLLTGVSQFGVTRQLHRIREMVGAVEVLPPKDAGRAAFDRLHEISVILEGVVLVAGLATIWMLAREKNGLSALGARRSASK